MPFYALFIVMLLDLVIIVVNVSGFVFTVYKLYRQGVHLSRRDWVLIGMYITYSSFISASFLLEYLLYSQGNIEFNYAIYMWVLFQRITSACFTVLAITWSSGYRFGEG